MHDDLATTGRTIHSLRYILEHGVVEHRLLKQAPVLGIRPLELLQPLRLGRLPPAELRLQGIKGAPLIFCLLQVSAIFAPASYSRRIAVIYSSVNINLFTPGHLLGQDSGTD